MFKSKVQQSLSNTRRWSNLIEWIVSYHDNERIYVIERIHSLENKVLPTVTTTVQEFGWTYRQSIKGSAYEDTFVLQWYKITHTHKYINAHTFRHYIYIHTCTFCVFVRDYNPLNYQRKKSIGEISKTV